MKILIVGGAGFIGSYLVDYYLNKPEVSLVVVYDNLSSGKLWHLSNHINDKRLHVMHNDIYEDKIFDAAKEIDVVIHLAANPDIARAASEPDIDFKQGTMLTQIVLEAIRRAKCPLLLYASGSGVYGDVGYAEVKEDFCPLAPISTYGASKLSCEALIQSYCYMFGLRAAAFRFGNVVGGRQTHGVAYDFIKKLIKNPSRLDVMGDGTQSKPYVYIDDIIQAMRIVMERQDKRFDVYNVAPNNFVTVREISSIVIEKLKISSGNCEVYYQKSDRGWAGDVPIVRLNCEKIRSLGWICNYTSKEAIQMSVTDMLANKRDLFYNA